MNYPKNKLFEELAEIEHQRWGHWQRYMHSKLIPNERGELVLPTLLVERWNNQIDIPYQGLSEKEKDSDRDQVMKYWSLVFKTIENALPDQVEPDEAEIIMKYISAKNDKEKMALANERIYGFNFCLRSIKDLLSSLKK